MFKKRILLLFTSVLVTTATAATISCTKEDIKNIIDNNTDNNKPNPETGIEPPKPVSDTTEGSIEESPKPATASEDSTEKPKPTEESTSEGTTEGSAIETPKPTTGTDETAEKPTETTNEESTNVVDVVKNTVMAGTYKLGAMINNKINSKIYFSEDLVLPKETNIEDLYAMLQDWGRNKAGAWYFAYARNKHPQGKEWNEVKITFPSKFGGQTIGAKYLNAEKSLNKAFFESRNFYILDKNGKAIISNGNGNGNESSTTSDGSTSNSDHNNETTNTAITTGAVDFGKLKYKANNYYNDAQGLSGLALYNALQRINKRHTNKIRGYGDLYKVYPYAFVDKYYDKDNKVLDIYSENPTGKDPYNYSFNGSRSSSYKTEGDMMNREHIVPQSWFAKSSPMRNDPQHVWPSDGKVNSMRSNFPHFKVDKVNKTSLNGSKLGTSNSTSGNVFEPINEFKGDVARAYFYFSITYGVPSQGGHGVFVNANTNNPLGISTKFLNQYGEWHKKDTVDQFDIDRNNGIWKYYNNDGVRNPFIDYPNLMDNLFNGVPFQNNGILVGMNK